MIAGVIIQNANAYEASLSDAARHFVSIQKADEAGLKELDGLLTFEGTKFQYFTGVADPEAISPDGYTLDQHYLDLPGRKTRLIDLLLDYSPTSRRIQLGRRGCGGRRLLPRSSGDARTCCSWKLVPALT